MSGAPKKPIDWEKVEFYLKSGVSQTKLSKSLGVDGTTLARRVKEKYGLDYVTFSTGLAATGEILLEAKQFQKAMEGNVQMLLWLGKVRLGQREPESSTSTAPAQENIDKDHKIMYLQHQLDIITERLNAYESKTE